jgi:ribosomal protein uL13
MIIINGENKILGRLGTFVAKKLILGEEVAILNSEKVVIVGEKVKILNKYKHRRNLGRASMPPFYPRRPDLLLKRCLRGMVPRKKSSGRDAFSRLKCYIGIPTEFKNAKFVDVSNAEFNTDSDFLKMGELSIGLGYDKFKQDI